MDTLGKVHRRQDQGQVEGADHRRLPLRRDHAGDRPRAGEPDTLLDLQKSLFSLTASRDREQSFESDKWGGGHGIFTYYVVKGLEGEADTNGDGVVYADELAEYVHTNVRLATAGRAEPHQRARQLRPQHGARLQPFARQGRQPAAAAVRQPHHRNQHGQHRGLGSTARARASSTKGTPLRLPGIAPGAHTIKAVHMGYEPDGPREEQVYPGQDTTVRCAS